MNLHKNIPILHSLTGSPELCYRKIPCLWLLGSSHAETK